MRDTSEFFLIETLTTRDEPFVDEHGGWGTRVTRPIGSGWNITDYHRDRYTTWQRKRPILLGPRRASRDRGGWLR